MPGFLRIPGTPRRLCDGLTRRDFLQVGGLGPLGLGLAGALPRAAAARPPVPGGPTRSSPRRPSGTRST